MKLVRWWWKWSGPHGPLGPTGGAFLFMAQVVLALLFLLYFVVR